MHFNTQEVLFYLLKLPTLVILVVNWVSAFLIITAVVDINVYLIMLVTLYIALNYNTSFV